MILAAIDDLMFSSKLRATAGQLGIDLVFARSPEAVLEQTRARRPALVIFDLNSMRCQPLVAIAALKADPELSEIKTMGFVSHVDTEIIAAAQKAGTDEVLPRSAFTAQLPDILERGR
jgi:PleD family two-component response regulator